MKPSLFRSGLAPRLAAAAFYGAAAFGAVALVERTSTPDATQQPVHQAAVAPAARPTLSIELTIDAVQPVELWRVQIDGESVASAESTASTWISLIAARPGGILSIDTGTASASTSANALRVRLSGDGVFAEHTFWCRGNCFVSLPIPEPAPSARTDASAAH